MLIKRKRTRRRFLQGFGGSLLALPLLEANSASGTFASPKRITATGIFYGFVPQNFHPQQTGRNFQSPLLLKPLESHRNDYSVFSGLDHNLSGGHNATKFFLSGIPTNQSKGFAEANISIDQKAANFVGGETRYSSLSLDSDRGNEHTLSWTRNGNNVQPIRSLEKLYRMLFRKENLQTRNQAERQLEDRKSILDLAKFQADQFKKGLGQSDADKLDQYFTSVREFERRIEQSSLWLDKEKPKTDYALPRGADSLTLKERTPLFYDLMTLALQTDSTRVISLAFTNLGKENGGLSGVNQGYHTLSHHGQVQAAIDELSIIESFHVAQFSRFLGKLKQVVEPNGKSLLDSTMTLLGSGMSNANSHSNRDLPVLLAGGGFKHGQHLHFARSGKQSTPLCNLYLSMLQNFGLEVDHFNTSSGTLTGLETIS
ncbi:MAG: DUF1552 domain-containing protein [Verrucomicrobiota bacterium]|jgi:hypothetical protein|nr:DUF1552 domain-containing protein [Verrucomicrobiota bacterium]HAY75412.1 hypothetical protein [Opitutae bacterium]MEC7543218.1 DUF1552 domain-containing protein [Verrucomicrobiota bacterium]MEC7627178.1 DUF1552 domain-containing protein [Verrucomicrobiota bacterium]MEC8655535.1 DUF1552 domain-containing protein [Verrucomicrobiota bacterium]|tara:strand:+ start:82 stop:1365 length:1284 start_codon:yes stop_codon:yes gene_type:complete